MIKSQLMLRIAAQNPHLHRVNVERIVNAILDEMVAAMVRGDRVELRGFGTFVAKLRKGRVGRNPKTGAEVEVPDKAIPALSRARRSVNASTPARPSLKRRNFKSRLPHYNEHAQNRAAAAYWAFDYLEWRSHQTRL